MAGEPRDPVGRRLWITLIVLLVLLTAVGALIVVLGRGPLQIGARRGTISGDG